MLIFNRPPNSAQCTFRCCASCKLKPQLKQEIGKSVNSYFLYIRDATIFICNKYVARSTLKLMIIQEHSICLHVDMQSAVSKPQASSNISVPSMFNYVLYIVINTMQNWNGNSL